VEAEVAATQVALVVAPVAVGETLPERLAAAEAERQVKAIVVAPLRTMTVVAAEEEEGKTEPAETW
jgi:hypothetical protein